MEVTTVNGVTLEVADSNGEEANWETFPDGSRGFRVKTYDGSGPADDQVVMADPPPPEEDTNPEE